MLLETWKNFEKNKFYVWIQLQEENQTQIPSSHMSAFWVLILITLILKITTIYVTTNDLLECVAKLSKIHKTKVGEDQGK